MKGLKRAGSQIMYNFPLFEALSMFWEPSVTYLKQRFSVMMEHVQIMMLRTEAIVAATAE